MSEQTDVIKWPVINTRSLKSSFLQINGFLETVVEAVPTEMIWHVALSTEN